MVKKNACILISGKGTNLKNLILKSREYNFPINIKLVVSNRKDAEGIIYAKKNSIPILFINTKFRNYENLVLNSLKDIILISFAYPKYMKIVPESLLRKFGKK